MQDVLLVDMVDGQDLQERRHNVCIVVGCQYEAPESAVRNLPSMLWNSQ